MSPGQLVLIPTVIAADTAQAVIPLQVTARLASIQHFLAEDIRTARRYLSSLKIYPAIDALHFAVLNKDTPASELEQLFEPLFQGNHLGVLSESGCPGVADPGALAVQFAHERKITVVPLVGPSSILLALMASGLSGQQFAFHGYLPIDAGACAQKIKALEKESAAKGQTQILIETPFRNNQVLKHLLAALSGGTSLSMALDLTGQAEFIRTDMVQAWKQDVPMLPKLPAVFLFLAGTGLGID